MESARLLEARGPAVTELCVGGKPPHGAAPPRRGVEWVAGMAGEDLVRRLVVETGFAAFDRLRAEHAAFVAGVFRRGPDAADGCLLANGYMVVAGEHGRKAWLSAPLITVFAADDPLAPGTPSAAPSGDRIPVRS